MMGAAIFLSSPEEDAPLLLLLLFLLPDLVGTLSDEDDGWREFREEVEDDRFNWGVFRAMIVVIAGGC